MMGCGWVDGIFRLCEFVFGRVDDYYYDWSNEDIYFTFFL